MMTTATATATKEAVAEDVTAMEMLDEEVSNSHL